MPRFSPIFRAAFGVLLMTGACATVIHEVKSPFGDWWTIAGSAFVALAGFAVALGGWRARVAASNDVA